MKEADGKSSAMRILGLDVGHRRIGVALSDELGWTARALTVIDHDDSDTAIEAIAELVVEHDVHTVVIGLPRRTDGSDGPEVRYVRAFGDALEHTIRVPIHYWDERFSTAQAERTLIQSGMRRARRRQVIDQVAAGIILQAYLDSKANKSAREEWSP